MFSNNSNSNKALLPGVLMIVTVIILSQQEGVNSQPIINSHEINPAFVNQHLDPSGKHLAEDDSLEAVLLNYLYAKQMVERLRNSQDISELQRKRSYWKQCAFNAVSCFGKK